MYLPQLTAFYEKIIIDDRITVTHICLYMAMFQVWNLNAFVSPISVSRSELMKLSKIAGRTTYHNHMKELVEFGYIKYIPSYHPVLGSLVWMNWSL
ncbi:MAG TPA: hypothetical protein VHZ50_08775 [Puia sp.]|nr:hypothetical protein [Puia sp.]